MTALPSTLALDTPADGATLIASRDRNNDTAMQTAVNGLIAAFSTGTAGQVLRALSSTSVGWDSTPFITSSAMSGGPPGSPVDGQIWLATGVDANGTVWQFRYNSGSASSFKWEFIGGTPVVAAVDTAEATTSAVFADLATVGPSITVARAGDYLIEYGFLAVNTTGGASNWQANVFKNAVSMTGGAFATFLQSGTTGWTVSVSTAQKLTALAAADVLKLKYLSSNGVSATFEYRWIKVTPVRVI